LAKTQNPIQKQLKWLGDVAQIVEYLPCKSEALSSNRNPAKKKKKKDLNV
jgi:hypothetical protein